MNLVGHSTSTGGDVTDPTRVPSPATSDGLRCRRIISPSQFSEMIAFPHSTRAATALPRAFTFSSISAASAIVRNIATTISGLSLTRNDNRPSLLAARRIIYIYGEKKTKGATDDFVIKRRPAPVSF